MTTVVHHDGFNGLSLQDAGELPRVGTHRTAKPLENHPGLQCTEKFGKQLSGRLIQFARDFGGVQVLKR
jgi:hypothetical protein